MDFFNRHHRDGKKNAAGEKGSVFTVLLGGIAMVGILSVAGYNLLTGPVATASKVTLKSIAEQQMAIASRVIMSNATGASGDCDSDTFVEPPPALVVSGEWRLPLDLGTQTLDPWGTPYRYCPFDPGTVNNAGCGGAGANFYDGNPAPLDAGATAETHPLFVLVSAGPDRKFQTTCTSYNAGNPTAKLVTSSGGDDLVDARTYAAAMAARPELWSIKTSDTTTAEIPDKDIEMGASASIAATTGLGTFEAVETGNLTATGGLQLGTPADCGVAETGLVRYTADTGSGDPGMQFCDGADWTSISGSGGGGTGDYWVEDADGGFIYYDAGDVMVGTSNYRSGYMFRYAQPGTISSDAFGAANFSGTSSTTGPYIAFKRGRGTAASPADVVTGDYLGGLRFNMRYGGDLVSVADMRGYASGTVNPAAGGTAISAVQSMSRATGASFNTPTHVRSSTIGSSTTFRAAGPLSSSFSNLPAAGSSIIVTAAVFKNTVSGPCIPVTLTDNQGNTYTSAIAPTGAPSGGQRICPYIFYTHNIPNPGGTFTVTLNTTDTNNNFAQLGAMEYTGLLNDVPDITRTGASNSGTSLTSASTGVLGQAIELAVGVLAIKTADTTQNITSGTLTTNRFRQNNASANVGFSADVGVTASTAAFTNQWSYDSFTVNAARGASYVLGTFRASISGGTDSSSASFSSTPTAGNRIIVTIACYKSGGCELSGNSNVTDNQGNSYTRVAQSPEAGGARSYVYVSNQISSSGTFTITVNPDGTGDYIEWGAMEVSGLGDPSNTASNSANGTSLAVSTAHGASVFVVGVNATTAADSAINYGYDSGGGWTERYINNNAQSTVGLHVVSKSITAAGTATHTWTHDSAGTTGAIVAFTSADPPGAVGTGIVFRASDSSGNFSASAILDHAGNLGIGTLSPQNKVHVTLDDVNVYGPQVRVANTNVDLGTVGDTTLRRSRGSEASPTSLATNDIIGTFDFFGRTSSNWLNTAEISAGVYEAPTATNSSSFLGFFVNNANVTSSHARMLMMSPASYSLFQYPIMAFNRAYANYTMTSTGTVVISDDATPETFTSLAMPSGGFFFFYPDRGALVVSKKAHAWTLSDSDLLRGSVQWGYSTKVQAQDGVAMGYRSSVIGSGSTKAVAMGFNATAAATESVSLGAKATTTGTRAVVVGGEDNSATGTSAIAIGGANNIAAGNYSIAMGRAMKVTGNNSIGINLYGTDPAPPAISLVQSTSVDRSTTSSPFGVSFSSLPTGGNTVVVVLMNKDGTTGGTGDSFPQGTVTDNQGNIYQKVAASAGSGPISIFVSTNIGSPSGTFTVTATPSGTENVWMRIMEVSGLAKSAVVDTVGSYDGYGAAVTSTQITTDKSTSQANTFALAVHSHESSIANINYTTSAGWTADYTNNNSAGTNWGASIVYRITTAIANPTHTWNFNATTNGSHAVIVALRGAAAGTDTGGIGVLQMTRGYHFFDTYEDYFGPGSKNISFRQPVRAGTTVIVNVMAGSWYGDALTSITDNAGNTYTQAVVANASNYLRNYIYYASNITAPAPGTPLTVTIISDAHISLAMMEVTGLANASVVERTGTYTNIGNLSSVTVSTSAATTSNPQLVIASAAFGQHFYCPTTPQKDWKEFALHRVTDRGTYTGFAPFNAVYKISNSNAVQTHTWTHETGCTTEYSSNETAAAIATFVPGATTTTAAQGNDGYAATLAQNNAFSVMNGRVGIGTVAPGYTLEVTGATGLTGSTVWTNASDRRLKDIDGSYTKGLEDIVKLEPVWFNYKKDNPLQRPSDVAIAGFSAQAVQKAFPEAVSKREDGYLELSMHSINVAKVNALKTLGQRMEDMDKSAISGVNGARDLEREIENTIRLTDRQIMIRTGKIPTWGIALPSIAVLCLGGALLYRRRREKK